MNMNYKHYIRINEEMYIIKIFSDAFVHPIDGDILLRESEQRHVYIGDFEFNPNIYNGIILKYKYINGEIIEV